jgi:lipid-A-disaccharide synthase-like uncharacterized protein
MNEFLHVLMQPMAMLGLVGQVCFFSRFLVQWIVSEREGRSTIPVVFWHLSIIGGILVLIYAIWRHDPVFTLGQSVGVVVYARNLILIYRHKREAVRSHA